MKGLPMHGNAWLDKLSVGLGMVGLVLAVLGGLRVLADVAAFVPAWTGLVRMPGAGPADAVAQPLWDWRWVVLVPVITVGGGCVLSWCLHRHVRAREAARMAHRQQLAQDRTQDAIVQDYLDQLTNLVVQHGLREALPDAPVRQVARAHTLMALQRVNRARRATIVRFLYELRLIGYTAGTTPIAVVVPLDGARLAGAILGNDGSGLAAAKFLLWATLEGGDVRRSTYGDGDWAGVDWGHTNLAGACLRETRLVAAQLRGAWLSDANLQDADLRGAQLPWANLAHANVQRANLADADLRGTYLAGTNLAGARLDRVNLAGCWSVGRTQLRQAASLHGAILPDHIDPADLGDTWSPPPPKNTPAPEP